MSIIDGKELVITPASLADVFALNSAIVKSLIEDGIKIDLSSVTFDPKNLEKIEAGDIGWVLQPILKLATDPNIRKYLFVCSQRAMFDKSKVDENFFEAVENRKYYYPIMMEVLKINLSPFFGLASSMFLNLQGLTEKFLKSK